MAFNRGKPNSRSSSQRRNRSRKSSALLFVVALSGMFYLAACGRGSGSSAGASNAGTTSSTAAATPTVTLNISPGTITAGQSATLTWSSVNATSVTIDNGMGQEGTSGSLSVKPAANTTYTATATGADGTSSPSQVSIIVTSPPPAPPPPSAQGVFTHKYNNTRQGANATETVLTPQNVNSTTFGKLFTFHVDGYIFGQPLYVPALTMNGASHNVVYVATEHDSLYAFDADGKTLSPLWKVSFLLNGATTVPQADVGGAIFPEIGITSTPVIDPTTATIYVDALTKENGGTTYIHRLHALDLTTGDEKFGGPVEIQASVPGVGQGAVGGKVPFTAKSQLQRPALTLYNGLVLIGFGSNGDHPGTIWHGWVLAYNAATLQQVWQHNVTPNAEAGAIWMSGGGFAIDAQGGIYYMSANGTYNTATDYGDNFVRMNSAGQVMDYFTPDTQATDDSNDIDLGAGGPMILPDQGGPNPHLVVGAGKDQNIYLVDRDNMGKFGSSSNTQIVQELDNALAGESLSQPAYWNGFVYFSAFGDALKAFTISNGQLSATPVSKTPETFSASALATPNPIVSSNGTANGILWAVGLAGTAGTGTLYAYDATNLSREFYNSTQAGSRDSVGTASKFAPVTVINGKVYASAVTNLVIYGLLD